jgi:hypothetical protein
LVNNRLGLGIDHGALARGALADEVERAAADDAEEQDEDASRATIGLPFFFGTSLKSWKQCLQRDASTGTSALQLGLALHITKASAAVNRSVGYLDPVMSKRVTGPLRGNRTTSREPMGLLFAHPSAGGRH